VTFGLTPSMFFDRRVLPSDKEGFVHIGDFTGDKIQNIPKRANSSVLLAALAPNLGSSKDQQA